MPTLPERLARDWPASSWTELHTLLAVSGGADSVALLRAATALKQRTPGRGQLIVAHFNHRWRGAASEADARWVAELCQRWNLPLELGNAEAHPTASDRREAVARDARYQFLIATAERLGARLIVTAHTADDQVETVLHRLIRGTGLSGLAGIPRARKLTEAVSCVRPLLGIWRQEIVAWLDELGQTYRSDASNDDLSYTRNRIRHELLPRLRSDYNQEIDPLIWQLSEQAGAAQQFLAEAASELAESCLSVEPATADAPSVRQVVIDVRQLASVPPVLVREVCKRAWRAASWPEQAMTFSAWTRLAEMILDENPTPQTLPGGVRVLRQGTTVVLRHGLTRIDTD